ncbi:MAG: ABC transporter substrate-binding protein [Neomegalonema sp.]|nr:ABC transporter substrate-binding protein [Neomegalonema sp.]
MPWFSRAAAAAWSVFLSIFLIANAPQAEEAPERIVVLGGSLTEIVFALGEEKRLIGADSTSFYPPAALKLAKVGYYRRLSAEGVLSVTPDLILADAGAGPQTALDQLKSAGVRIEIGPAGDRFELVLQKVRFVGRVLEARAKATKLEAKLRADMSAAKAKIAAVKSKAGAPMRVVVLLSARGGGLTAAGEDTAAASMIALAGASNAVAGYRGYKPFSAEAAIAAAPDAIIAPTHVLKAMGGAKALLARPEIAATPAGKAGRVIEMDGLLLLGMGPRTPAAALQLAEALYIGK